MAYIDLTYAQARVRDTDLRDLTRDSGEPDEIVEARINAMIEDAQAVFDNAALQAGYSVPIADPDPFIRRVVFDIFLYYLYARKYDDEEMKDVYVRYNKAFSLINQIKSGEVKIQVKTSAVTDTNCIIVSTTEADRVFKPNKLKHL